jgi:CubicO group peptidase (beta-lactamase class C family)
MRAWIVTFSLVAATVSAAERPAPANEALARIAARAEATHSDALLVMRGDDVLLERYAQAKAQPIELMSATKSVVALLVGRLVALGRIESLDQPVHAFYPEWRQGQKQRVTLRMLLNHTSGMQNVQNAGAEIYPAPDVIQLALAAELGTVPGSAFSYNNKAVNLLAGVIERAGGVPMDEFARRELFEPLGIEAGPWHKDAAGHPHAMAGLPLRAADAAKLGRLVIERGRVGERVLIPEDYLRVMLEPGSTLYAGAGSCGGGDLRSKGSTPTRRRSRRCARTACRRPSLRASRGSTGAASRVAPR